MYELLKVDNDRAWAFYYQFICETNPDWKKSYMLSCAVMNKVSKKQEGLSDYEYFLLTRKNEDIEKYILLVDKNPITLIGLIKRNDTTRDISFSTIPKMQHKGYATKAVQMIEELLFKNGDVLFTTIIDMNPNHYSKRIAERLGYTYDKAHDFYLKGNPNLSLEEFKRKLKLSVDKRLP